VAEKPTSSRPLPPRATSISRVARLARGREGYVSQSAEDAYAAFGKGDAEGAMRNIDDSVEWMVRGDNALTGTYNGKQAVGELWAQFGSKDFRTEPHDFIADGDKVVVHTTIPLEGDTVESADILTYNGGGKLVAFDTRADAKVADRVFAK
jgi:uncharacterized protein